MLNGSDKQPAASQPLHQAAFHRINGKACRSDLLLQIKARFFLVFFVEIFHPLDPDETPVSYRGTHSSYCSLVFWTRQKRAGKILLVRRSSSRSLGGEQSRPNNRFSSYKLI